MVDEGVNNELILAGGGQEIDEGSSVMASGDAEMSKRDIRHNMIVCVMLDTIWSTGWIDFQVALQPLLAFLKASNVVVGFVNGATVFNFPGMFLSPFISRKFGYKKWYLFATNVPYMGMIGLIGLILVLSGKLGVNTVWLLSFVVIAIGVHKIFEGFVALPHQEYVAQCIPMSHRGRYNGLSNTFGSVTSLASAAVGAWILSSVNSSLVFNPHINIPWLHLHFQTVYSRVLIEHVTPTMGFGSLVFSLGDMPERVSCRVIC